MWFGAHVRRRVADLPGTRRRARPDRDSKRRLSEGDNPPETARAGRRPDFQIGQKIAIVRAALRSSVEFRIKESR
jgi:hypothetical protein